MILSVTDDGRQLDLDEIRSGPTPRGRELAVRVADAVLRLMGGRATAELQRRGHVLEERTGISGDVQSIHVLEDGTLLGAADRRRGGQALGY